MPQIFSGNANAHAVLEGGATSLQQAPIFWQELVKRHVLRLTNIDKDATKLYVVAAFKNFIEPHSRSHRTTASQMPNVYMEVGTMLANMLDEAVRSAQLEHNRQWQELKDGVVSHLGQTGMAIDTIETQVILPSSSLLTILGALQSCRQPAAYPPE